MNRIVGVLAVLAIGAAGVALVAAKRPARRGRTGAGLRPTGSIPMGAPGRAMSPTAILPQATDYMNRYTAWVASLPLAVRLQAPAAVLPGTLQGRDAATTDAILAQHAQQVQLWWDSVKGTAAASAPTAPLTAQQQAAAAFAALNRMDAQDATAALQNQSAIRFAVDNYAAWLRTVPVSTPNWTGRNWQSEAPKMPPLDLSSPTTPSAIRLVYTTALAWWQGQPQQAGVPQPPALAPNFPT